MDKSLKYLVGISAIIIAGCAAYFSITGLGILFAGASVPVMVMAGSLEYAKLVTATYLKQKWDVIKGFNKWYLTGAVVILMAITSAGIFGYLSNAFQQQNIKLDQVAREIQVWQNKIEFTNQQITTLQGQQKDLSTTQNTLITKGNVNNRLLRSVDNRDRQSNTINKKINVLQDSIVAYNGHINDIKNNNIELEREVGGFRFVAEAFGANLNTVVKFFIFLIVIVFDPLAIALVIAFNQLVLGQNKKEEEQKEIKEDKTKEIIEEESRLKLSEEDLKLLESVLLNPPPNENLKRAAEEYNEKVIEKKIEELDNYFENTPKEEIDERVEKINEMVNLPIDQPLFPEAVERAKEIIENSNIEEVLTKSSPFSEMLISDQPLDEEISIIEPTEEEESRNFSTIEPISENIFQDDQFIVPIDETIDNEPELTFEEGQLPDDMLKVMDEVQNETFSSEPTSFEEENNERMDIIGQNGNEGLHYEKEDNTSSEQDDEKKN